MKYFAWKLNKDHDTINWLPLSQHDEIFWPEKGLNPLQVRQKSLPSKRKQFIEWCLKTWHNWLKSYPHSVNAQKRWGHLTKPIEYFCDHSGSKNLYWTAFALRQHFMVCVKRFFIISNDWLTAVHGTSRFLLTLLLLLLCSLRWVWGWRDPGEVDTDKAAAVKVRCRSHCASWRGASCS